MWVAETRQKPVSVLILSHCGPLPGGWARREGALAAAARAAAASPSAPSPEPCGRQSAPPSGRH